MINYELVKLYPQIKIPTFEYADYYISVLLEGNIINADIFADLKVFNENIIGKESETINEYKYKIFQKVFKYFVENCNLSNIDMGNELFCNRYLEQKFSNYNPDNFYVSIDLREANFQSYKIAFPTELNKEESWVDFLVNKFNVHPLIAKSKSYRQFILGNLNPKRANNICKYMMEKISVEIEKHTDNIVCKKSDEIILEFKEFPNLNDIQSQLKLFKTKQTIFKIKEVKSFDEIISIKEIFSTEGNIEKKELINIPLNRFFIHLKENIIHKPINEFDLTFTVDKRKAKWII